MSVVLHQTWKTPDLPDQLQSYHRSWLGRGLELRLWTDRSTRAFVASHYPELLRIYDGLPWAIQRTDLARYLWLHAYGGIYADLDVELHADPDPLLAQPIALFTESYGPVNVVSNALMVSAEPRHPFWAHVVQTLVRSLGSALTQRPAQGKPNHAERAYILTSTGPYMLTRAVASWPNFVKVTTWPTMATHHRAGTWWR